MQRLEVSVAVRPL